MNALPIAFVGKMFEGKIEFFTELKKLTEPKCVRAFHQVPKGLEVTFYKFEQLAAFVAKAPQEWLVRADVDRSIDVTLTPKIGSGHVLVPDSAMWATMERFGEVESGYRPIHKDLEEWKIETGSRVFRLKPRVGVNIPSSLTYGRASFVVTYKGMVPKCHRCQETGHNAKSCSEKICFKCRGKGHISKHCNNGFRCTVCWRDGHSYDYCGESKKIRVVLTSDWTKKEAPMEAHDSPEHDSRDSGQTPGVTQDKNTNSSGNGTGTDITDSRKEEGSKPADVGVANDPKHDSSNEAMAIDTATVNNDPLDQKNAQENEHDADSDTSTGGSEQGGDDGRQGVVSGDMIVPPTQYTQIEQQKRQDHGEDNANGQNNVEIESLELPFENERLGEPHRESVRSASLKRQRSASELDFAGIVKSSSKSAHIQNDLQS